MFGRKKFMTVGIRGSRWKRRSREGEEVKEADEVEERRVETARSGGVPFWDGSSSKGEVWREGRGYESVWQLSLTLLVYCRERRSAGWPIFWSTTRSRLICCHQRCERCWEKFICVFSCMARWRSWTCGNWKLAIAMRDILRITRRCC